MNFKKMHGLGNDYIYVNCMEETIDNPSELAIKMSKRHFGVGADGLILIKQSVIADFKMEMYNADGSLAEMCGNGIRCVGKYVYDNKLTNKTELKIETMAGIKTLYLEIEDKVVKMVTVEMGEPILDASLVPVLLEEKRVIHRKMQIDKDEFYITCVSMGNPHTIIFVEDMKEVELERLGPVIEQLEIFPKKTNVEFVEVINDQIIRMRVWERGTGVTLACGTGACASVVASVLNGVTNNRVDVILDGGILTVDWNRSTNQISMRGPAEFVFDGEY